MNLDRLAALGVFDPGAPDRDDQAALLEQLVALGATEDELVAASDTRMLGVLALELAMRSPGPRRSLRDAAAEAGIDPDRAERSGARSGSATRRARPRCWARTTSNCSASPRWPTASWVRAPRSRWRG